MLSTHKFTHLNCYLPDTRLFLLSYCCQSAIIPFTSTLEKISPIISWFKLLNAKGPSLMAITLQSGKLPFESENIFLMKYFIFYQILFLHHVRQVAVVTKILPALCLKECGMTFSSPFASITLTVIFV
jgi:hypothetical protein